MSIQRLHTDPRMSQVVVHGGVVYLAGQVDLHQTAATTHEQMARVLRRIDELLAEAGSGKGRLLSATIWLADIKDFVEMNRVWVDWLPPGCAPARATVQSVLAFPALRVEVAVTAAVGAD